MEGGADCLLQHSRITGFGVLPGFGLCRAASTQTSHSLPAVWWQQLRCHRCHPGGWNRLFGPRCRAGDAVAEAQNEVEVLCRPLSCKLLQWSRGSKGKAGSTCWASSKPARAQHEQGKIPDRKAFNTFSRASPRRHHRQGSSPRLVPGSCVLGIRWEAPRARVASPVTPGHGRSFPAGGMSRARAVIPDPLPRAKLEPAGAALWPQAVTRGQHIVRAPRGSDGWCSLPPEPQTRCPPPCWDRLARGAAPTGNQTFGNAHGSSRAFQSGRIHDPAGGLGSARGCLAPLLPWIWQGFGMLQALRVKAQPFPAAPSQGIAGLAQIPTSLPPCPGVHLWDFLSANVCAALRGEGQAKPRGHGRWESSCSTLTLPGRLWE